MPNINPTKNKDSLISKPESGETQKMQAAIEAFFMKLTVANNIFNVEETFEALEDYIKEYNRILYSPISNNIFIKHEDKEYIGNILSNLDSLINFSDKYVPKNREEEVHIIDTKKAILKIWDHVNLANQQYENLRQTDKEYKEKFEKNFNEYKEDLTKEMNAQLLTMVSIFTALAFLIFGGISSLDDIFGVSSIPILRLISLGLIWGLCMLNLVFVFLFCVGKMTKLNFKSNDKEDATIFQKYPIVWWCNFVLISLFILSMWVYFIQQENISLGIVDLCVSKNFVPIIITALLIVLICFIANKLAEKTEVVKKDKTNK